MNLNGGGGVVVVRTWWRLELVVCSFAKIRVKKLSGFRGLFLVPVWPVNAVVKFQYNVQRPDKRTGIELPFVQVLIFEIAPFELFLEYQSHNPILVS